jgi:hypothetical protein
MTASASGSYGDNMQEGRSYRGCGRFARNPWSIWEIGAMVAGFVIFWPLGLLALFLKWKNGEMWRGASEQAAPWAGFKKPDFSSWHRHHHYGFSNSGNAAFDDYKREALRRLDEERRRLDEEQKAFREFVEKLRRAKDQDEFDRFMAERRAANESPPPAST